MLQTGDFNSNVSTHLRNVTQSAGGEIRERFKVHQGLGDGAENVQCTYPAGNTVSQRCGAIRGTSFHDTIETTKVECLNKPDAQAGKVCEKGSITTQKQIELIDADMFMNLENTYLEGSGSDNSSETKPVVEEKHKVQPETEMLVFVENTCTVSSGSDSDPVTEPVLALKQNVLHQTKVFLCLESTCATNGDSDENPEQQDPHPETEMLLCPHNTSRSSSDTEDDDTTTTGSDSDSSDQYVTIGTDTKATTSTASSYESALLPGYYTGLIGGEGVDVRFESGMVHISEPEEVNSLAGALSSGHVQSSGHLHISGAQSSGHGQANSLTGTQSSGYGQITVLTGTQNLTGTQERSQSETVEGDSDDHNDDDEILRFISSVLCMVKNDLTAKKSESYVCDGLTLSGEDELITKTTPAECTVKVNPNAIGAMKTGYNNAMKTGCTRKVGMSTKRRGRQWKSRKPKRSPPAGNGKPNMNSDDKTRFDSEGLFTVGARDIFQPSNPALLSWGPLKHKWLDLRSRSYHPDSATFQMYHSSSFIYN